MKIAFISPLPPVRSGIAHYSALLLPALAERFDLVAVVDQNEVGPSMVPVIRAEEFERRSTEFDAVVCQLGNNVYHEFSWKVASRGGAIVVLHDIVMHHLLVELTLAHGDAKTLEDALTSMYGEAGQAIAAARAHGIHDDLPNFLYPASEGVARNARHVIVHNHWAAERLRQSGISTPITVAPLPYSERPLPTALERDAVRRALGFEPEHRIIGVFGFVTHAKRPGPLLRAFAEARKSRDDLRLLFVGEPSHNVDLGALAREAGVPAESWASTGFVSDEQFDRYLAAVDRVVNLRYPSAGETSGPLFHAFAMGRPVAVSDYAQFADFPIEIVTRIPFDTEIDSLASFMLAELDLGGIGNAQRAWLRAMGTLERAVAAYVTAIESLPGVAPASVQPRIAPIPLFPRLSASIELVTRHARGVTVSVNVLNEGDATIPAMVYGQPPFVIFAKARSGGLTVVSVSVLLTGDLAPGVSGMISIDFADVPGDFTLELRHGLGGIADVERSPFFTGEVRV